jgi:hypothetical protein
MRSRTLLAAGFLGIASLLLACSNAASETSSSEDDVVAGDASFSPYPTEMRDIRVLGQLSPQNTSIANFAAMARDQGKLASCASHGFIGMLENQLWIDKGITVDLSERFQIYSNYLETKSLGGSPEVIQRFPDIVAQYGVMNESVYDYAGLNKNGARFMQDHAQGLATDPNALTIDKAIEGAEARTKALSAILEKDEFIGKLPAGPYPIELPLKAELAEGADVGELEFEGKLYRCFDENPDALPADKKLRVTPRELAHKCLRIEPKKYFACDFDRNQELATAMEATQGDECAKMRAGIDHLSKAMATRGVEWLDLTMRLLDRGQAVMMGVFSPANQGPQAVWRARGLEPGGGHAVTALGYVTYAELQKPEEQTRGMLGEGIFDRLAGAVEPEYQAKLDAHALPTDPAALRDARLATKLGMLLKDEGGLILFRNSWGRKVGDMAIGIDGFQSMTFDFFIRSLMLVQSRENDRVPGVQWQSAGPSYCPTIARFSNDPWLAQDHAARLKAAFAAEVPPQCGQQ